MNEPIPFSTYRSLVTCLLDANADERVGCDPSSLLDRLQIALEVDKSHHDYIVALVKHEKAGEIRTEPTEISSMTAENLTEIVNKMHKHSKIHRQDQINPYDFVLSSNGDQCNEVILNQLAHAAGWDWCVIRPYTIFQTTLSWATESIRSKLDGQMKVSSEMLNNQLKNAEKEDLVSVKHVFVEKLFQSSLHGHISSYVDCVIFDICATRRFFPPESVEALKEIYVKAKFAKMLSHSRLLPEQLQKTLDKHWTDKVKEKIQIDVCRWLEEELYPEEVLEPAKAEPVITRFVEQMENLNEALQTQGKPYANYLKGSAEVDYFDLTANKVDEHIKGISKTIITMLNCHLQQFMYNTELVEQVSKLSMRLYHSLKGLLHAFEDYFDEETLKTTDVYDYQTWFEESLTFWLATWSKVSQTMIEKTFHLNHDLQKSTETTKQGESSVVMLNLLITGIINDWNALEFENTKLRTNAIIEITSIFGRAIEKYGDLLNNYVSTDMEKLTTEQLMTAANSVYYTGTFMENKLPSLLHYDKLYDDIHISHSESSSDGEKICTEIKESLNSIIQEHKAKTVMIAQDLVCKLAKAALPDLRNKLLTNISEHENPIWFRKLKRYVSSEKLYEIPCLLEEIVTNFKTGLYLELFSVVVDEIWYFCLGVMEAQIKPKQEQKYYAEILVFLDEFNEFMQRATESKMRPAVAARFDVIYQSLKLRGSPTIQLIISHYAYESEKSQEAYLFRGSNQSYLEVRIGCLKMEDGYQFLISLIKGGNLEITDTTGSPDYYVVAQFLPALLFQEVPSLTSSVKKSSGNPKFNEILVSSIVPKELYHSKGSVLDLAVWDKDRLSADDYIGETMVQMQSIPALSRKEKLESLEPMILNVRKCKKETFTDVLKALKERAYSDDVAQDCIRLHLGKPAKRSSVYNRARR